jgi:hypothetical protein
MKYVSRNQGGFGYLGILITIVVVLGLAGTGWWVSQRNKSDNKAVDTSVRDAIKNAKCDYDDKDLCKFFTAWKGQENYTAVSVSEVDGQKTTTTIKSDGEKSYLKLEGAAAYEVITIGNTTYTKAGDTWWKQTTPNTTAKEYQDSTKVDFEEPAADANETAKTTYKKVGKEKCGNFNCFKYQVVDPSDSGSTTFLWFDDEDYQLRRTQTTNTSGTYDTTFSYDRASVTEPSPVKELGPDQYILPGQSEPVSLPAAGDGMPSPEELQQLMEQYQ